MNIDEIAQQVVTAFNADNTREMRRHTELMCQKFNREEGMFSIVKRPYLVAKSLYFMLTEDYLSAEDQMECIKLAYFCLLKNFLDNKDCHPTDTGYELLVQGSKLCVVLISMQHEYLMYSVIMGEAHNVLAEKHIRNQIQLFTGIVKEAKINDYNFLAEDIINKYFQDIFTELYEHIPTGQTLYNIKNDETPAIKSMVTNISLNFKEDFDSDFMDFSNDF